MKAFQTINKFIEYVPSCLICDKNLNYIIEFICYGERVFKGKGSYFKFPMIYKSPFLEGFSKKDKLIINPNDNHIIDGSEFIFKSNKNAIWVRKSCSTCDFKIISRTIIEDDKLEIHNKTNYFPEINLQEESLNFTLKGGKKVCIFKNHGYEPAITTIIINNKYLPNNIQFKFDEIRDFKHLTTRLSTIKTFY